MMNWNFALPMLSNCFTCSVISSPLEVNLNALERRLFKIWLRRKLSPRIHTSRASISTVNRFPSCCACRRKAAVISAMLFSRLNS